MSEERFPLTCPGCNQRWSIDMPKPEVLNGHSVSSVTISHPELTKCPNKLCLQPFLVTIANAQLTFQAVPLTPEQAAAIEGTRIVKPSLLELVQGNGEN